MNSKRQTIWLVSMLSLMVILSAYYLLTGDKNTELLADADGVTEASAGGDAHGSDHSIVLKDVGGSAGSGLGAEDTTSNTDQEVLKQLAEQGTAAVSSDYFSQQQFLRGEKLQRESEQLLAIIADTKQKPEDANSAFEQLHQLEAKEDKKSEIEEELLAQFGDVIIAEENDNYKVVVQSENLEKSQAASILDLVSKTMDVPAEKVSVQFIP
ncbi:SpoIIIAH-like family protein [Paenibacillaceae bacterium]|nr:SpoIIIAH-like family protein [Paenibacillaceae bacterium]